MSQEKKTELSEQKCVIIGCGWLGKQIGQHFSQTGWKTMGSYRSNETALAIKAQAIEPFYLDLNDKFEIAKEVSQLTNVLVLALPPLQRDKIKYYGSVLMKIAQQFPKFTQVIFTNSTGIYPKRAGVFDESYMFSKEEQLSSLYYAEQELSTLLSDRLTILRLGGLIGPYRHPVKYIQGRKMKMDGSAPINFVSSRDIINAIDLIVSEKHFGFLFNLVYPDHPAKNVYYPKIIKRYGLKMVEFGSEKGMNRCIDGELICKKIGFSYLFDVDKFSEKLS
eukprot:241821_1